MRDEWTASKEIYHVLALPVIHFILKQIENEEKSGLTFLFKYDGGDFYFIRTFQTCYAHVATIRIFSI